MAPPDACTASAPATLPSPVRMLRSSAWLNATGNGTVDPASIFAVIHPRLSTWANSSFNSTVLPTPRSPFNTQPQLEGLADPLGPAPHDIERFQQRPPPRKQRRPLTSLRPIRSCSRR